MITCSQKKLFWAIFIFISVGAAFFSFRYFSRTFPIVNLDIRMSRAQALEHSAAIAKQFNLGPNQYRQAALFNTDSTVQTYVELEAGGADAYNMMVTGTLYSPYSWQIRHAKPYETNELIVIFKPDGTPYGFVETIAEETAGSSLTPEQAEVIARQQASSNWKINFNDYTRVEISKETRPNGRIDHTFIYERPNITIGKALYRLRLVVTGDKLTELSHFVKVPEEFLHHYKEMRSANNTIAHAAQIAMIILYIMGIGLFGLFFILRKKYLIWKSPLTWGLITALLSACASLSNFPLLWFNYPTTSPVHTFIIQYLFSITIGFVFTLALHTTIFMIAESLTRLALPKQGQLWKTWTLSGGSSWQTLGRTLAAYLLIPLYFADVIIFYRITMRYLGWWTPASQLTDPNVLASYLPWVNAVAPSLSAGFLEECLFRAFPLAAAILLGRRYGKQNWWIAGAFIIQILIFGAAHANYAAQPAYARLVELVIFSALMGIVYLKFGLLIGIISHAVYDLIWFSLPIFISSAHYAWINQLCIILIGLIPLVIILIRRFQWGSWHHLETDDYNEAWQPAPTNEQPTPVIEQHKVHIFSQKISYVIIGSGIVGLAFWALCTKFSTDTPALNLSRSHAQTISRKELDKQSKALDNSWTILARVTTFDSPTGKHSLPGASSSDQHKFIWQKGGTKVYKSLLGTYLEPAHWDVRLIKLNGCIQDRAEEYFVSLGDATIFRTQHTLAEEYQGKQLTESDARIIAHKAVREIYHREPETFKEISAVSTKQPNRLDWNFTLADTQNFPLDVGQARILITIAGDQVSDHCQYMHVPEDWVRSQETDRSIFNLINMICYSLLFVLVLIACMLVFKNSFVSIKTRHALTIAGAFITLWMTQTINNWPSLMAMILNAQEPYFNQIFRLMGGMIIGSIFAAGAYTIAILMVSKKTKTLAHNYKFQGAFFGIATGLCWAGLSACLKRYAPSLEPFWGDFNALESYIPTLTIIVDGLSKLIFQTTFILLIVHMLNMISRNKKGYALQICIIIALGCVLMGAQPILTLNHLIITAIATGLFFIITYYSVVSYIPATVVWITGTTIALQMTQQAMLHLYPSAIIANILGIIIIMLATSLWYKTISRPGKDKNQAA